MIIFSTTIMRSLITWGQENFNTPSGLTTNISFLAVFYRQHKSSKTNLMYKCSWSFGIQNLAAIVFAHKGFGFTSGIMYCRFIRLTSCLWLRDTFRKTRLKSRKTNLLKGVNKARRENVRFRKCSWIHINGKMKCTDGFERKPGLAPEITIWRCRQASASLPVSTHIWV